MSVLTPLISLFQQGYKLIQSSFSRKKCNCKRHGLCAWSRQPLFYSTEEEPRESGSTSGCEKKNESDFRCDAPYHPVGEHKCTGAEHGDQCELLCPDGFVKEQHGHGFRIYFLFKNVYENWKITEQYGRVWLGMGHPGWRTNFFSSFREFF